MKEGCGGAFGRVRARGVRGTHKKGAEVFNCSWASTGIRLGSSNKLIRESSEPNRKNRRNNF